MVENILWIYLHLHVMYAIFNCNVNHQNGHNYFQLIPISSGFIILLSTQVLLCIFRVMNADIVYK